MDLSKIKSGTFYGDVALNHLRLIDETLPEKMMKRASEIPCYDGKEVVVMLSHGYGTSPYLSIISYISGNDDPALNGWILRLFKGVKENSAEHLEIIERIKILSHASLINTTEL